MYYGNQCRWVFLRLSKSYWKTSVRKPLTYKRILEIISLKGLTFVSCILKYDLFSFQVTEFFNELFMVDITCLLLSLTKTCGSGAVG